MAVRADRRQPIALEDALPVDALHEGVFDCRMALSAGLGNIELVDRRLLIVGGEYLMRAVAIGADGSLLRPIFDGLPMHALLVREEGLGALPIGLHQELLPMA